MTTTNTAAYATLKVDLLEDGTVLKILLDQPKGNVLSSAMMKELDAALEAHRDNARLRMVFLRGAGAHFSFGASVQEHRRDLVADMLGTFHALARKVAAYPVPVAALVEGRCLGGAFELVLCCHLAFAAPSARFGCPEIKLGVFPPILAVLGPGRLGTALAERMILTGEDIDVESVRQTGLVSAIFDGADPEQELLGWYRDNLQPLSAFALRQAARAIRQTSTLQTLETTLAAVEQQYLREVVTSHDGNEGIEAFLERRTPQWRDA